MSIYLPWIFAFLFLLSAIAFASDFPCADQLQRCATLIEEFERQLHDLKNSAFRNCFTNTACVHEKIAFDDCYAKSLRAMQSSNASPAANNDFLSAADAFRSRLDQCFTSGGATVGDEIITLMSSEGIVGNGTMATEGSTAVGDVARLGRAIYGMELADRLWGLPPNSLPRDNQLLNTEAVCSTKEPSPNERMFGGGISRIADTSSPQLNNMNTSCTLGAAELSCFGRLLGQDPQYRLLMSSKDKTLRSCIQNVRLQYDGKCQFLRPSSHRCICEARDELDNRMQTTILNCVQHSPVAQLYAALSSLSRWNSPPTAAETDHPIYMKSDSTSADQQRSTSTSGPLLPSIAFQTGEEPLSVPSSVAALTPGTSINGQCFCVQGSKTTNVLASNDYVGKTTATSAATLPASGGVVSIGVTPQIYRPLPAMPWYYQPMQTALSAEAGIANGFERFFNGQPPLRVKREN